jgi:hypothetical protein
MREILGPVGQPGYREYARDIQSSSLHLLQIINDILDVSKIEAGMATLHETAVDFGAVVQACCRLVAPKAVSLGITLTVDLANDLPRISADERMLKQVILNLLSNALKFTPGGGAVELAARAVPEGGLVFTVKGYRHRHRARGFREDLPTLRPGRFLAGAQIRRNRPRPAAHQGAGRASPRQPGARERGRLRYHRPRNAAEKAILTPKRSRG